MQSMEGRLTKIRGNLRTKRKFSLPLFLNYFHQEVVPATSTLDPSAWDALEDPEPPAAAIASNDPPTEASGGSLTPSTSGVSSIASSLRAKFGVGSDGSKPVGRQSTRSSSGGNYIPVRLHLCKLIWCGSVHQCSSEVDERTSRAETKGLIFSPGFMDKAASNAPPSDRCAPSGVHRSADAIE